MTDANTGNGPGPDELLDVIVIGAGQAGLAVAWHLAQGSLRFVVLEAADRPVDVSVGEKVPMLPQRLLGRDLFWWLTRLRFMRVNTATRLGRRLQARGEFVIGTNRRRLKQAGVRFRPRFVNAQGRTARFADDSSLEVPVVVWATGYRSDYSWISIAGVTANGRVVHRRGVTDVPGLYFLGLSWQYTRGSALLGFVADDGAYLTERIAARAQAGQAEAGAAPEHPGLPES